MSLISLEVSFKYAEVVLIPIQLSFYDVWVSEDLVDVEPSSEAANEIKKIAIELKEFMR